VILLAVRNVNHGEIILGVAFHLLCDFKINKRFVELLHFNSEVVAEIMRIWGMFLVLFVFLFRSHC